MTDTASREPDPHLDHLVEANRAFADQIRTADQKAAYVFTFLVALLVWSSQARQAFRWRLLDLGDAPFALLALVMSSSFALAVLAAILAVVPKRGQGGTFLYWGAWPAAGERLAEARAAGDEAFLFAQYMENTRVLAVIAARKFRLVALSFRALFVGVLAFGLLALIRP